MDQCTSTKVPNQVTENHRVMVMGLKACVVTDNRIIFIFMSEPKGVCGRLPHRKPLLSERKRGPFRQPAGKHHENNVTLRLNLCESSYLYSVNIYSQ